MKKLLLSILLFLGIIFITNGQTYQLTERAVIASSSDRMGLGENNFHVDAQGNLHALFFEATSDTDFVFHSMSANNGLTWTAAEEIGHYAHISNSAYRINYVNGMMDDNGKWHVVFNYRGYPLYSASSSYPPEHVGYISNESGNWTTYMDVMNDSLALASNGELVSTNYLYGTYIYSQGNEEYISAYDYAWFAQKSFVLKAKRTTGGTFDSPGTPIVTYDRGDIDKYSLRQGRIFGDGNDFHALWFNRYTGELNVKTESGGNWGATNTLFTVNNPIDGVPNVYGFSSPKGTGGNVSTLFSRWEDNGTNSSDIYTINKSGANWTTDHTTYAGKVYYPRAIIKNDTTYGLFLPETFDGAKFFYHTSSGFSNIMDVLPPSSETLNQISTLPNRNDLVLYVRVDPAIPSYTLAVGELSEYVGVHEANPTVYECNLFKVFPNPSAGNASVSFVVESRTPVSFEWLNAYGRVQSSTAEKVYPKGVHRLSISELQNGQMLSSGIYFLRMRVGEDRVCTQKVVILNE